MAIIKECGEKLVDIKKHCPRITIRFSSTEMEKFGKAYVRKTVAEKLCEAQKLLPDGMMFVIRDAWRPSYIQKAHFKFLTKYFTKKHPSWSELKISKEVEKYVNNKKGKYASGHMAGGAVDIRLAKNGRMIPMKSKGLAYQENAKSLQKKLPVHIQKNREIMFNALKKAGFSNNPREYWHWSYGDIYWAERENKKVAIYGVIENIYEK
jgi:D-alanyl-D-alanine dipeptidase